MEAEYFISIYHDTRREKKVNKYPVKLRVFTPFPRTQKLYNTIFALTIDEFKAIWENPNPRSENRIIKLKMNSVLSRANEVAESIKPFDFDRFEASLYANSKMQDKNVNYYYGIAIENYKLNGRIGTALNYESSLKSLLAYHNKEKLNFHSISKQWLKDYEKHITETKGLSITTVGFYLRPLRSIFNVAIDDKAINKDLYPFGKKKYNIPISNSVKKALNKDDLKTLFEGTPNTPEQEKAKAFWFFSYFCNGMNVKDIANLKFKNIDNNKLSFERAKTKHTNLKQKIVSTFLNDFSTYVIKKYGNLDQSPENYIFPIFDPRETLENRHSQIKNFIRAINQNFKKYAEALNINSHISTYWARHSFATTAIRKGASMEMVSEMLSHSNLRTTQVYFAGFDDKQKQDLAIKLMEF